MVAGLTWYPSHQKKRNRVCKKCHNNRVSACKKRNPVMTRVYAERTRGNTATWYKRAKWIARRKNARFTLREREYIKMRSSPCAYCSGPLCKYGIGLDQIVAGRGYVKGNVVPCCGECNRLKSDKYTYDQALHLGAVVRLVRENKL